MEKKIKTVIIGGAHVHILEVAKYCFENEHIELVACADTIPYDQIRVKEAVYTRKWNINYVKKNYGLKVYDSYIEMLDTEQPELAAITCENALHADIVEECAKRGIAVSVEKPMAISLSEGLKMMHSAKIHNTLLMVNWPIAWRQYYYQMKNLIDEGRLGKVLRINHYAGNQESTGKGAKHRGVAEYAEEMTFEEKSHMWWFQSSMGGGAMLDFCCYGCMSSSWLLEKPAVAAIGMRCNMAHPWGDAEDNAGMMVMFPDCFAVLEGSWTHTRVAAPAGPEILGTEGSLVCEREGDGVYLKLTDYYGNTERFEPMNSDAIPINIADAYTRYKIKGEPLPEMVTAEYNLRALAILDAGVRSAESGKLEVVRNDLWQIG